MDTNTNEEKEEQKSVYETVYSAVLAYALQSGAQINSFNEDLLIFEKNGYSVCVTPTEVQLTSSYDTDYEDPEFRHKNGVIEKTYWRKTSRKVLTYTDYINNKDQAEEIISFVRFRFAPPKYE